MTKTKIALIVVATLVLGSCAGCVGLVALGSHVSKTSSASAAPAPAPATDMEAVQDANRAELSVADLEIKTFEFGSKAVVGKITNMSGRKYELVNLEINLFDADGAVIGSTLTNVSNFTPGQVWKFKAHILEREAVRAEIKEITAF